MIANSQSDGDSSTVPSDVLAALRHTRRREIIERLHAQGGRLSLVALAHQLVTDTDETLPDVLIELPRLHLPALTRCGLVAYNEDTEIVTLDADSAVVEAALAHIHETEQ